MDSLIAAAARALAIGDPLGALNRVALRDDAPALALRGIAMAQLGDLGRAKALMRRAARAFGPREVVARARCVVAEAEIALASRDLARPTKALAAASATLEAHGDRANAAHARYLEARRLLLIGRLDDAERKLAQLDLSAVTPALRVIHELAVAGIAMRRVENCKCLFDLRCERRNARPARRFLGTGERCLCCPGADVHGVSFDGAHVWVAVGDRMTSLDPASGKTLRSIDVPAHAGTAFDGKHLFQISESRIQKIDPETGRVLARIPAPGGGGDSGLAWAEGTLWVGQYRERKIHQIDPETGAILRTIESNRFVTGVTWVDGELWHGTWEGDESELRHIDPRTGEVLERIEMPRAVGVSGLESDGGDRFFCGSGSSGTVRAVRRPKRGSK